MNRADAGGAENQRINIAHVIGGKNEGARPGNVVQPFGAQSEEDLQNGNGRQAVEPIGGGSLRAVPADGRAAGGALRGTSFSWRRVMHNEIKVYGSRAKGQGTTRDAGTGKCD